MSGTRTTDTGGSIDAQWQVPAPFDGSAASLAEHAEAVSAMMAGRTRLWLGPFAPPDTLDAALADTALVVPTSGSTGSAKAVALSRGALIASQDATARLLAGGSAQDGPTARRGAGHGLWLPLLAPTHIAGVQVLARACRAAQLLGREAPLLPSRLPELAAHFDARLFCTAAHRALEEAQQARVPACTSLVPTQLGRLMDDATDAGIRARELLCRFDAVLVGGAACPAQLLERARERGIPVRVTYGSSETAGGCVYDGHRLDGVALRIAPDSGRLVIASPTLALGYVLPDGTADLTSFALRGSGRGVHREFLTSDLASLDSGRLEIRGRADDVIITGGAKINPLEVERALAAHGGLSGLLADAVVVGVPDEQWGQRLVALVVPADAEDAAVLPQLVRTAVRSSALPAAAVPKTTLVCESLPHVGVGKIDRSAARRLALRRGA